MRGSWESAEAARAIEASKSESGGGRVRLGMIGGGEGAFIGAVHRLVTRIDDHYDFVAGALSSTPEKARRSGRALGLDAMRAYPDFAAMLVAEPKRADGIEAVAIGTPNHVRAPAAAACLAAGLHVICDKPLAATLAEGRGLTRLAARSDRIFAVTYNYTGYPMIREARAHRRRRARKDPRRAGRVRAGLADRAARAHGPEAGGRWVPIA